MGLALFKKFKKPEPREHIKVTLEELATLWLKYNQGFQPQPLGEDSAEEITASVEPQKTEPALTISLKSTEFLSDLVEPYRDVILGQGALEGIYKIIELLDEHGGCPSVVTTAIEKDSETEEIYSIKDILHKVTLKNHTFRVAKIALKLLKETQRDYENLIPKMLVAALGHDLGKIPVLRESGLYVKADHPLISAQKVNEIFMGKDIIWLSHCVEVIKNHHRWNSDPSAVLLRKADGHARELEVAELSQEITIKEWDEWFDAGELLQSLKPHINTVQAGRWEAFSFSGVVYVVPGLLINTVRGLASKKKVIDMTLLRGSDKEIALRKIVDALRKANAVAPELGDAYFGRTYEIQLEKSKRKMFLVPLKIEALGLPSEIEKGKEGILQLIKKVIPAQGQFI